MKKVIIILAVLLGTAFICNAGQKEELMWELKYRVELSKSLESQYKENQEALKKASQKLKALNDAEKAKEGKKNEKKDRNSNK